MIHDDYYAVLGISRGASTEDIVLAYRSLVRRWHPDLNPGVAGAEEQLKRLNEAYGVLRSASSRARYDRLIDLFSSRSSAVAWSSPVSYTIAERRKAAVVPLLVTVLITVAVVYMAITCLLDDSSQVPWQAQRSLRPALVEHGLSARQIEMNTIWVAQYWHRELEMRPASRHAAQNLADTYLEMGHHAARRGDVELAERYRRTATILTPADTSADSVRG
jgi:hypothetical protein